MSQNHTKIIFELATRYTIIFLGYSVEDNMLKSILFAMDGDKIFKIPYYSSVKGIILNGKRLIQTLMKIRTKSIMGLSM